VVAPVFFAMRAQEFDSNEGTVTRSVKNMILWDAHAFVRTDSKGLTRRSVATQQEK